MTDTPIKSLGRLIAKDRRAAGMSMDQLSAATGLAKSTVSRIENDALENQPSPDSLQKLARALGTEVEDYFALAGYFSPTGLPNLGERAESRARYSRPLRRSGRITAS